MKANELRVAAGEKTRLIYKHTTWRNEVLEIRVIAVEKTRGQTWRVQTLEPPEPGEHIGPFYGKFDEDEDEERVRWRLTTSALSRELFVEKDLLAEREREAARKAEEERIAALAAEEEERKRLEAVFAVPEILFNRVTKNAEGYADAHRKAALDMAKLGARIAEGMPTYQFDALDEAMKVEKFSAVNALMAEMEKAMWYGGVPALEAQLYSHAFEDADTGWSGQHNDARNVIHEAKCRALRELETDIKWFGKKED